MLQYVSTFTNLKNRCVLKVVWNKRKEKEFVDCEEISGTPSCLWLHCLTVSVQYIRVWMGE